MKQWKCTVCGYIHKGEEPPEKCPVCGADKSLFISLDDDNQDKTTVPKTSETTTDEQSNAGTARWRCTVCGYIHKGEEPPDKCPVCGADKSMFEKIASEQTQATQSETKETFSQKATRWRCTVCGYIHNGNEPPDKCPVCGADKSKFIRVTDDDSAEKSRIESKLAFLDKISGPIPPSLSSFADILTKFHGHPISVHIPNGMLPVSVIFAVMAVLFDSASFAIAAKYNTIFVCITMPAVIATGIIDWKNRFRGNITNVFLAKMVCAAIVTLITLILSIWWIASPDTYHGGIGGNFFFLFFYLVALVAAAVAGWYGGKLVFHE